MTFDEYNQAERDNTTNLLVLLILFLRPYLPVLLTPRMWRSLITGLFPYVDDARRESAGLARKFYDHERDRQLADVIDLDQFRTPRTEDIVRNELLSDNRHPIDLPPYKEEWFHEAMEAVREKFSRENASESDLARTVGVAAKEAQNGGRATTRNGTSTDQRAIGWARVAGGGESCGFCEMLISRGPVYKNVNDAGLNAKSNKAAVKIWREYEQTGNDDVIMALMNRWHENCDCRVVPVFDRKSWPGKEASDRALEAWNAATIDFTGPDKLNAFRRYLRDGYKGDDLRIAA